MKTAVSLPDDLFARADELARRLRRSRSQLYRDALTEYLYRHEPHSTTEALDRTLDGLVDEEEPFVSEAARQILERTEW